MAYNNDLFDIFDFNNLFKLMTKNWYWFFVSVLTTITGAVFYIKISPNVYQVNTSVIKNESTSVQKASEQLLDDNIKFISESRRVRRGENPLENEIMVLKSSGYLEKAIQGLDLQVSYFQNDRFIKKELYETAPFLVILKPDYPQPVECEFIVNILNNNEFEISVNERDKVLIYNLTKQQEIKELPSLNFRYKGRFDQSLHTDNMDFKLLLNSNFSTESLKGISYSFTINTQKSIILWLQWDIQAYTLSDNILGFSMETTVPQKAIDILSNLTYYYSHDEYNKKLEMANKAIDYIDNQLYSIQNSLKTAEAKLQRYQTTSELVDITRQSGQIYDEISRLEGEKAVLEMNLRYYKYIDDYFKERTDGELLAPSAMGIEDDRLNSLINELISLKAEKLNLIENQQDKSPYLRQINIRIENLQKMAIENISYYTKTSNSTLKDINARIDNFNKQANDLPKTQRELLGYERQYDINDKLYSYLMEKKAEAEIAKASIQSEVEVLEPANTYPFPVAPKKKVILFAGFVLGILIPFGLIGFMEMLRKTFTDEDEIKKRFDLPVIGRVYRNTKKGTKEISQILEPHVLESFNKVRNKINYFISESGPRVITISSTISQEGKSFISKNLAVTLAAANFKTVLLGFDLRKPRIFDSLGITDQSGISDYYSGTVGYEDIKQQSVLENLDVIIAGQKPPNPAALISSPLTETLFEQLRGDYDYIIVDTPPIGIVTDGLPLLEIADLSLFVIRIKRSLFRETETVINELEDEKRKNLAIIINDVPADKKGRYGYGYYGDK
ncbi:MAG: polysaccharide biosynthesis tyrosine autokinase [Bacteroidales bacterium]|nr:polysaccharide biosynthesis tyrosine autokinase [Bacteroidales bacterium]MBN2820716.1 polysaccharide biosynthesis tyrosine autokinase [Bacteroidales bacterium]